MIAESTDPVSTPRRTAVSCSPVGKASEPVADDSVSLEDAVREAEQQGLSRMEAIKHVARERGIATLGLLGGEGGPCLPLCDHSIVVNGVDGAGVQEAHQMVMHMLCEACEARFARPGAHA